MFDEQMKKPYLFISILVSVFAAETLIFYYTSIDTPSLKPAVQEKRVHINLASVKPAPPEHVCRCQEKVEPEPKPKPKPKPKPRQIHKPKPIPKHKPVHKPKPVPKPKPLKKEVVKPPKPVSPSAVPAAPPKEPPKRILPQPASRPEVSAQKTDSEKIEKIKAAYLIAVREKIERNKYYPRSAKKLHQTGKVELKFTILKDGSIKSIEVVSACRHSRLNRAAVKTLERIGKFAPLPDAFDTGEVTLKVPINYMLKRR